jgi:hypothetical protein
VRPTDRAGVNTGVNQCPLKGVTKSTTRIQLALNVEDVSAATAFYEKMFGTPPHKARDGYANFAIEGPPLKLVLARAPI